MLEYIDYYKERDRVVFTALFHSKRGYCCGNKCRHCPYIPKYIKNNKNMLNLEKIKQLRKESEELHNSDLTIEQKQKEALNLFIKLNDILSDIKAEDFLDEPNNE